MGIAQCTLLVTSLSYWVQNLLPIYQGFGSGSGWIRVFCSDLDPLLKICSESIFKTWSDPDPVWKPRAKIYYWTGLAVLSDNTALNDQLLKEIYKYQVGLWSDPVFCRGSESDPGFSRNSDQVFFWRSDPVFSQRSDPVFFLKIRIWIRVFLEGRIRIGVKPPRTWTPGFYS